MWNYYILLKISKELSRKIFWVLGQALNKMDLIMLIKISLIIRVFEK
ncbi:hypothetical protein LEP1GSC021_0639 [Leptospira noguchii str. 1993005606]|uniref:Uncharacterized protein n=2 Tax=Leptospira noguchii TaxID=28182 RepID=M6V077_9LEPT|nr:hypothetical protein LEP1GSC035_1232 [Leptospira noguchii str. 2007001578]EMO42943.1 hypothetical protein LEP1GSC186_4633 [Leptospira noguchii serovar Autumnalis str. ZUN142]EPE82406.1 hypothetical protein LEP1GSC021_0639 [Leptospira noguchii str. 1993005606]